LSTTTPLSSTSRSLFFIRNYVEISVLEKIDVTANLEIFYLFRFENIPNLQTPDNIKEYLTSPLLTALSAFGTHYCDITGETDWVRDMIDKHDAAAKASGARIVHFCGHDCVPWDLAGDSGVTEQDNDFPLHSFIADPHPGPESI
jgi:hypothetical protein